MTTIKEKTEPLVSKPLDEEKIFEPQDKPVFVVGMSEEDSYLVDKMKSQPKSLDEVLMVKERQYAPGEHRLTLPKELKAYENKFTFRWINKKRRAIDEATNIGWVIVNKTLFPEVALKAKHLFTTNGAITVGDCVLAFINKDIAIRFKKAPGEKSSAIIKSQLEKGKKKLNKGESGFYAPETSGGEEGAEETGKIVQREGKDF